METCGKAANYMELARCLSLTGSWNAAAQFAEATMPWNNKVFIAAKEAVAASSLSDLQGGSNYRGAVEAFLETLRGYSVWETMKPFMWQVPLMATCFTASMPIEGTVADEGTARPIQKLDLLTEVLEPVLAVAIIVVSKTAWEYSGGKALALREMRKGVTAAVDTKLFSGLQDHVGSNVETSAGTGVADDLKTMLTTVATTGAEKLFLIVPPSIALSLSTAEDASGLAVHPDMGPGGGSVHGVNVLVSENLPAEDSNGSTVILIDAASICYGEDLIEMKTADAGLIDLSDNPDGSQFISLFQNDLLALKLTRPFGWKLLRDNAVSVMTEVNW